MIAALSRFRVSNARQESLRDAFSQRVGRVDAEPGFLGLEVFTDCADDALFYLFTRWSDEACFRAWHGSDAFRLSQRGLPRGFKLDPAHTKLTMLQRIDGGARRGALEPAVLDAAPLLAEFLHTSREVLFAECAEDGTPRAANPAFEQLFQGQPVWQRLTQHDADAFHRRLAGDACERTAERTAPFELKVRDAQGMSRTLTCHLARRQAGFVLIAQHLGRGDEDPLYGEVARINNELSAALREKAQQQRALDRALAALETKNAALLEANRLIEALSRTDALTGVHNRRHLDDTLASEIVRARRQCTPLSLVMVDLDHFKVVNDLLGHAAGDAVLAATGRVLAGLARPYDTVARYGGEEFVVLLPGAASGDAAQHAGRLCRAVAEMRVEDHDIQVTASFGVATLAGDHAGDGCDDASGEDLLRRADAALYRAKANGRNRVEVDDAGAGAR